MCTHHGAERSLRMNETKLTQVLQYAATKTQEFQKYEAYDSHKIYYVPYRCEQSLREALAKFISIHECEPLSVDVDFLINAYARSHDDYEAVRQEALKAIETGPFEHNFLAHWLLLVSSEDSLLALAVAFGKAFKRSPLISIDDVEEELDAIDFFVADDLKAFFARLLVDIGVIEGVEDGYALAVPKRELKALRPAEKVAYSKFTSVFRCREALFPFKPYEGEER